MSLTRRSLLASLALTPVCARARVLGAHGGEAVFDDAVRQISGVAGLSPVLMEGARDAFLARFGRAGWTAFTDAMDGRSVEDILSTGDAASSEHIRFIASVLFTGEIERGGATKVALYPWSLAWATLDFAKAPGLCGGPAFGHWAHAP